jgi:hypothetical protein
MDINEIISQELAEFARDYDRPRRDYGDRTRVPKTHKWKGKEYAKNRESNDETHELRRKVMQYIYDAKNLVKKAFDYDQPRVNMRIVDWSPERVILQNALACATGHGTGVILIPAATISSGKWERHLKSIVYHEILHATYCVEHDESSPLMHPIITKKPLEGKELDKWFIKHVKESGKVKND